MALRSATERVHSWPSVNANNQIRKYRNLWAEGTNIGDNVGLVTEQRACVNKVKIKIGKAYINGIDE